MKTKKLSLKDTITIGKNKKVSVADLCKIKGEIFKYIKQGYWFDDEVLDCVGIKKTIRNVRYENAFVVHNTEKQEKILPKDTESLKNILKSLNTLDNNCDYNEQYQQEETNINVEE